MKRRFGLLWFGFTRPRAEPRIALCPEFGAPFFRDLFFFGPDLRHMGKSLDLPWTRLSTISFFSLGSLNPRGVASIVNREPCLL
jgi:hypothetical protein